MLAAGQVESFHQFGWIGGLGILACWVATFTVVPAALVTWDQRRSYKARVRREPFVWLCRKLADGIAGAPRAVLIGCAILTVVAGVGTFHRRHDPLETNMSKLGTKTSSKTGIQALDERLRKMDTGSSTPAIVATSSREEAKQVCDVLQPIADRDPNGYIGRCITVDVLLPVKIDERKPLIEKLAADLSQGAFGAAERG